LIRLTLGVKLDDQETNRFSQKNLNNKKKAFSMNCPLCTDSNSDFFHQDRKRLYLQCPNCDLVFVHPDQLPSPEDEKTRYLLHQNDPTDNGYIDFLQTFINPLKARIRKEYYGLDYGSGPKSVLADLLRIDGYQIVIFDPFFANESKVLKAKYDYLTCVEVVEHFHNPRKEWATMIKMVKPFGWIGIKTTMIEANTRFSSWYYKGDPTHVCFYSQKTFIWIGNYFGFEPEFEDGSTVFFKVGGISV